MNKFDKWNELKKQINNKKKIPYFREGQIWFISIGINIGFEQDGKGEIYSRPVLILKKINKDIFFGIPLTTKEKKLFYYFSLGKIKNKENYAILSQIRLFSSKRLISIIGGINKNTLKEIKQKISRLIE